MAKSTNIRITDDLQKRLKMEKGKLSYGEYITKRLYSTPQDSEIKLPTNFWIKLKAEVNDAVRNVTSL